MLTATPPLIITQRYYANVAFGLSKLAKFIKTSILNNFENI
jgi:hypothetical protein